MTLLLTEGYKETPYVAQHVCDYCRATFRYTDDDVRCSIIANTSLFRTERQYEVACPACGHLSELPLFSLAPKVVQDRVYYRNFDLVGSTKITADKDVLRAMQEERRSDRMLWLFPIIALVISALLIAFGIFCG